jgi:uncharacterized protein (TIGR03437 family)
MKPRGFFLLTLACALAMPGRAADRIRVVVDPGRTVVLRNHVPRRAQARFDQGPASGSMPVSYATLRLRPAAGLEVFLEEQRNPASPNYHHWLTPEQFADRFGLSQNDIGQIAAWLRSEGFQVHDVARGRIWITFSGTAEQVNRAFHTQLHRYSDRGQIHFANATDPSVPAAFQDVVSSIDGLDNFGLDPLYRLTSEGSRTPTPEYNSGSNHFLAPDDFATIYNVTPLYTAGIDGSGQRVAVIGQAVIDPSDVALFRSTFHLPPSDPELVLYGPTPGPSSGDALEAQLDIQWAGAVARNATIVYVYSNSVNTSAQYAVDQNLAPVITLSYGGCEAYNSTAFRAVAQQAVAQGITWLTASGDWGAATCDITAPTLQASKGPSPSFPSTIPEITSVGGTGFDDGNTGKFWAALNDPNGASALSYIPERAWNDSAVRNDLAAGGGGPSLLFAKPAWQTGPGVPDDNARDTPDISFAASPQHYAYAIFSGGRMIFVGGTSVASPAFAGMLALLNQYLVTNGSQPAPGLGNINPALYRLAQTSNGIFHDITVGDILLPCTQSSPGCTGAGMGYIATPGYDLATGLGSADAYQLVTGWKSGTSTSTRIMIDPDALSLSDTATITVAVSGDGGVPTGSVTILVNDTAIGTVSLDDGSGKITINGTDVASGNGTITALYSGDAIFENSKGVATVQLRLPSSGSLVVPVVSPNPVPQSGFGWPYMVNLTEKAGVPTTLTRFTIDGVNNLPGFAATRIPANGTIRAMLIGVNLPAPINRLFVFAGKDDDGTTWTQQLSIPFVPGASLAPSMKLTSVPAAVAQDPQADPSCRWSQQILVEEDSGFAMQLTRFSAGITNLSSQIQTLFGTTRLAPFGSLQATLCWDSLPQGSSIRVLQIGGTSEVGTSVTGTTITSYGPPAAAPSAITVSNPSVAIVLDGTSNTGTATLSLKSDAGDTSWTVSTLPDNRTTRWLSVSPGSGSGSGDLTLQASADGLANGVYRASVTIQAPNSLPQTLTVPVTLVVGASTAMTIDRVSNNASGSTTVAPGMQVAVHGSQLAPSALTATRVPVPLSLSGVSATVNGVSAPVFAIAPDQVNVQIPYETGLGTAVLAVNNNGKVASYSVPVAAAAPGIFPTLLNATTGERNSAHPGDVMTIYITGAGDLIPSLATGAAPSPISAGNLPRPRLPLIVSVGGSTAQVSFVGNTTGSVGVLQINFTVPADVQAGTQPLVVSIGGSASDPVSVAIATN